MDVAAYLARIGFGGPIHHDPETLEALQRAHLTAVPFENLDVYYRRGVETGVDWSIPKVVERGRGGWCYELNGAFAALLEALGFEIMRLGGNVLLDEPSGPGADPGHLALEVVLERRYLVDVGFGDSYIRPLPLDDPGPHDGGTGWYGFEVEGPATTLVKLPNGGDIEPQYRFRREPVDLDVFNPSSRRLQTQAGLQWTESPFATRLLDGGPDRVTLLKDRLRLRRDGEWTEEPVARDDWPGMLQRWFEMEP